MGNLTVGTVQREFLAGRVDDCQLTIVSYAGKAERHGDLWLCQCTCGNWRKVIARDFQIGRVKRCRTCSTANSLRNLRKGRRAVGDPIETDYFEDNWKVWRSKFTHPQRLLYETILNGREDDGREAMEAVDIVRRCRDIPVELNTFSVGRVLRAKRRLDNSGEKFSGNRY